MFLKFKFIGRGNVPLSTLSTGLFDVFYVLFHVCSKVHFTLPLVQISLYTPEMKVVNKT
jgi:hypothetical protein